MTATQSYGFATLKKSAFPYNAKDLKHSLLEGSTLSVE